MTAGKSRIDALDNLVMLCEQHVESQEDRDGHIASLLAQSLLIKICAACEALLRELVMERCAAVEDASVHEYLESCTKTTVRRLQVNEVAGVIGRFGKHHKGRFQTLVEADQRSKTGYSSLITNRIQVAHEGTSNATLRDVKEYFNHGRAVLDYAREALWETAGLD